MFGPRHEKFREALELIKAEGGITFDTYESFREVLDKLLDNESFYLKSAKSASLYVNENTGATEKLMGEIMHRI
jgi:3-deoxy-D-manno-octulosonic-acid transferase